jgi:hypothetical protein
MAKYDGLLYTPATDLNFINGIQRLKDADLEAMFDKLHELNKTESGHKGRIRAVEKEMDSRGEKSKGMVAVNKMHKDIETAERLYGDGMPYELDRIENEIKFYLAQTAQALFESGKRFQRIKAHEKHGDFMASLERIGVSQTTADYAMAVVKRFGPNSPTWGNLGSGKLKVLCVLDEPDIRTLAEGQSVNGVTLDDVNNMTVLELREALRKERKRSDRIKADSEKELADKKNKIDHLQETIDFRVPLSKKEEAAKAAEAKLEELKKDYFASLMGGIADIRNALYTISLAERVENVTYPMIRVWLNKYTESVEGLTAAYEELLEAIKQPCINNGEEADNE